jgi:hypothetical protein
MTDPTTGAVAVSDSRNRAAAAIAGAALSPLGRATVRVAAVTSVLAGLIHYGVVPEHRAEWWLYAVFFTLLGAFEMVWAFAIWTGSNRRLLLLGVLVNVATLVLWTVTRTTGLPFGPEPGEPEQIGIADTLCVAAEVATVVAAMLALRRQPQQEG